MTRGPAEATWSREKSLGTRRRAGREILIASGARPVALSLALRSVRCRPFAAHAAAQPANEERPWPARPTPLNQDDANDLYREDIYSDRKVGILACWTPVKSDGTPDPARPTFLRRSGADHDPRSGCAGRCRSRSTPGPWPRPATGSPTAPAWRSKETNEGAAGDAAPAGLVDRDP